MKDIKDGWEMIGKGPIFLFGQLSSGSVGANVIGTQEDSIADTERGGGSRSRLADWVMVSWMSFMQSRRNLWISRMVNTYCSYTPTTTGRPAF